MPDTVRKLDDRALATQVLKSDEFIKKVAQAFGEIPNAQVFKDPPDTPWNPFAKHQSQAHVRITAAWDSRP